jgi:hypothetical protein
MGRARRNGGRRRPLLGPLDLVQTRDQRRQLVALVVTSPTLIWNATNDWEGFRFQFAHGLGAIGGAAGSKGRRSDQQRQAKAGAQQLDGHG